MSFPDIIDLSSDDEAVEVEDVKPTLFLNSRGESPVFRPANIERSFEREATTNNKDGAEITVNAVNGVCKVNYLRQTPADQLSFNGDSAKPSTPLCRKFWKAGDYETGSEFEPVSRDGKNHLRVHPKFLHSNATSHKWAFGAIAELLDNAIDEIQKGATFVNVDLLSRPSIQDPILLVQDDGSGMDPESLRSCISFGFSDKRLDSSIGQYGNGFKTSTMRLGADAVVFSRCMTTRTQSIGLLSYTFLRQTGSDDIVVPMVDYEFDLCSGICKKLIRHTEHHFSSNLSAILKWSPFAIETDLLKQFDDIGQHGTKIMVFNLWYNDEGVLELDFISDELDIIISGALQVSKTRDMGKLLIQKHIATRLRYSLRAYASILYLHLPEYFRIILRGQVVQPHKLINDLRYIECIKYTPHVGGLNESLITTIGFLEGAPNLNIHGFNVYHKNRLILPFWRVVHYSHSKGRGVAGILEANFIKPTHDKQDFEKSTLYCKLEARLKEMTVEYWDYHCHLVGYPNKKISPQVPVRSAAPHHHSRVSTLIAPQKLRLNPNLMRPGTAPFAPANMGIEGVDSTGEAFQTPASAHNLQIGGMHKRKDSDFSSSDGPLKRQALGGSSAMDSGSNSKSQYPGVPQPQQKELMIMVQKNKSLHAECLACDKTEKELMVKAATLKKQLKEAQDVYERLKAEMKSLDEVKIEKM